MGMVALSNPHDVHPEEVARWGMCSRPAKWADMVLGTSSLQSNGMLAMYSQINIIVQWWVHLTLCPAMNHLDISKTTKTSLRYIVKASIPGKNPNKLKTKRERSLAHSTLRIRAQQYIMTLGNPIEYQEMIIGTLQGRTNLPFGSISSSGEVTESLMCNVSSASARGGWNARNINIFIHFAD